MRSIARGRGRRLRSTARSRGRRLRSVARRRGRLRSLHLRRYPRSHFVQAVKLGLQGLGGARHLGQELIPVRCRLGARVRQADETYEEALELAPGRELLKEPFYLVVRVAEYLELQARLRELYLGFDNIGVCEPRQILLLPTAARRLSIKARTIKALIPSQGAWILAFP